MGVRSPWAGHHSRGEDVHHDKSADVRLRVRGCQHKRQAWVSILLVSILKHESRASRQPRDPEDTRPLHAKPSIPLPLPLVRPTSASQHPPHV